MDRIYFTFSANVLYTTRDSATYHPRVYKTKHFEMTKETPCDQIGPVMESFFKQLNEPGLHQKYIDEMVLDFGCHFPDKKNLKNVLQPSELCYEFMMTHEVTLKLTFNFVTYGHTDVTINKATINETIR